MRLMYCFYKSRRKLYGNVFKTHLLGCPIVRVVGASNVRKVLLGENTLVTSYWPASVRMMMGSTTISMSSGESHRMLRKGVAKAFNHEALSGYAPVMQQQVRDYLARWCDLGYVQGHRECQRLTFAIAWRALTGLRHVRHADQEYLLDVFQTYTDNLFSLPIQLPGCGLSKGLRARKALLEKIENCIRERESQPEVGKDALSLLMRLGGEDRELTNEELKNVCLELLFAGHATASSASTSLFYFLAKNPPVVQRILEELEEHGLLDGDADDLTYDILSKLTYAGHVVKEVLRLAPPIGAGFRRALKTFELDGYQVPKGWNVVYSIRETQMFSDLFDKGDSFDPDRWQHLDNRSDETFHYLPFGRGARSCVGKEYARLLLKILTVELTRSCSWTLLNEDVQMRLLPVPHPTDGLPMHITFQQSQNNRRRAATV
nr:hypothetical protein BaRGS_034245 [Batillaria attramentaria]